MKLINSPFLILMALLRTAISSAPASVFVFVAGKELDTKTNLNPRRLRPQPAWTIFTSKAAKTKANVSMASNRSNGKSTKNKITAKIFKSKSARSKRKKVAKSAVAAVRILL
eukprot:scaffold8254_cov72-Skeletonema_dohrnii-CCMP3373.AAC.1